MSAVPKPALTRVCRTCQREKPLTEEYFRRVADTDFTRGSGEYWRRECRVCAHEKQHAKVMEAVETARAVKAAAGPAKWKPRVMGEGGPEGGYTEHPVDGYKWFSFPDTHGIYADWQAIDAALALSRWYRPKRIILLGDHGDLESVSRFDKPPEAVFRIGDDIEAVQKFMRLVRESNPDARIEYLEGNHERRFKRYLWKHPEIGALMKWQGMDLARILGVADYSIEYVEAGFVMANERFMWKHGNAVRGKSAASAMAELDKNGISGASGHTHRLGLHYKTTKAGVGVWCESGCLCGLDPPYAEGQTMDWQQGVSLGSVALRGNGFTVHPVPIVNGRARILGADVAA